MSSVPSAVGISTTSNGNGTGTEALTGVFSGINTDALVTAEMAPEQQQLTDLQTQVTGDQTKVSDLSTLNTGLTSLETLLNQLRNMSTLEVTDATSSNSGVASATTAAGASQGSHSIVVNQLATAEQMIQTTGLASATSTIGSSNSTAVNTNTVADSSATWFTTDGSGATYSFQFGSENAIAGVAFAANTSYSMDQVASMINTQSQAASGYNAATVTQDSSGNYQLTLTSRNGGSIGTMADSLTAGDAISQIDSSTNWTATDGADGSFSYTYQGVTRTFNGSSTAGNTLQSLVTLINQDGSNPGVTASVLQYNNGYHLVLSGNDTGASNNITINDANTTMLGFKSADIVQTQAAQDAEIQVDGFPSSTTGTSADWITRSSNTISDVIPNVTLTLGAAGSATISVTADNSQLETNLNSLVTQYNALVTQVTGYTDYNSTTQTPGIFEGDSGLTNLLSTVRSSLLDPVPGFVSGKDTYTNASQLGFSFDQNGVLSLDSSTLDTALTNDYQGVLNIIGAANSGSSDSQYIQFSASSTSTTAGAYQVQASFDSSGNLISAQCRPAGDTNSADWQNMTINGDVASVTDQVPSEGLTVEITNDGTSGAHTQTANINLKEGFAGVSYSSMKSELDPSSGILAIDTNSLNTQITDLNTQITAQQQKIDTDTQTLKNKYAQMEATLALMNQQQTAIGTFGYNATSSSSSSSGSSSSSSGG
jgi:flagellar hook-associated protein 2